MKTILVDAIGTFVVLGEGIDREMFDLLETYPNRKIILTSANDEQMDMFGLRNMPYEVFSLKHSPEKDDSEYYKKMLSHFGLTASEVTYFEHSSSAVKSAKSVGIVSYRYDSDHKDLTALKAFIDSSL